VKILFTDDINGYLSVLLKNCSMCLSQCLGKYCT